MQQTLPAGRAFLLPGQVDIRPFLQQASIFALSSVTEALPNVVLEAMADGSARGGHGCRGHTGSGTPGTDRLAGASQRAGAFGRGLEQSTGG